jgi:two-component system heavy metal sensor histidine kinase CusS
MSSKCAPEPLLARVKAASDARRWSLTSRMTLFFAGAIAVILVGVSAMMYHELVHQLHEKEEIEIRDAVRIELGVLAKHTREATPDLWHREWTDNSERGQHFSWRLLTDGGLAMAASRAVMAPPDAFAPPNPRGKFRRYTARVDGVERHYLLVARRAPGPAGAAWVMQGVLDVTEDQNVVERYRFKLLLALSGAIALSGLVGWLLARQGLAPVRAISKAIAHVDAHRLQPRIVNDVWPADLRALAQTFDATLARLAASFEQLQRFSSDLAHEFRSPINNLVAAASVTLTRARDPAEYQETLEVVVEQGERLSRMVSSMLFLARADNAKQSLALAPLDMAVEFGKLLDFFDAAAEEGGVELSAAGACRIVADPLLLRRALSNLIANALHYTPRGGAVALAARTRDGAVEISVLDSGAGIAAEHLPHLFDRFYRADAARSSSDSTGLGLAVVRSIVELHGGTVGVDSVVGEGARFTLLFPQAGRG